METSSALLSLCDGNPPVTGGFPSQRPVPRSFDVFITMTSQWAWWRLRSPASRLFTQPFIQTQIKENIKAPRHWPLCGEFTGTGEFPAQRASYAEYVSIWWRHHVFRCAPEHTVEQTGSCRRRHDAHCDVTVMLTHTQTGLCRIRDIFTWHMNYIHSSSVHIDFDCIFCGNHLEIERKTLIEMNSYCTWCLC